VTGTTREVVAVIFGVTGRAEVEAAVEMLAGLLRRHCGAGEMETWFVD
jgi:DNA/RNA-binding domain of Phe-tRNA-synthetase-like protein